MEFITEIANQGPGGMIILGAIGYASLTSIIALNGRKSKGWR